MCSITGFKLRAPPLSRLGWSRRPSQHSEGDGIDQLRPSYKLRPSRISKCGCSWALFWQLRRGKVLSVLHRSSLSMVRCSLLGVSKLCPSLIFNFDFFWALFGRLMRGKVARV